VRPPVGDDKDGEAAKRANRKRSIAIAVALGVMVLMFYAATIVHLGGNVINKGM
jgi:3-deoxy-D-manno-octulosonic-acid transferase